LEGLKSVSCGRGVDRADHAGLAVVTGCLAAVKPDGLGAVDDDGECVCCFGGGGLEGGEESACEGMAGRGEGGLSDGVVLGEE